MSQKAYDKWLLRAEEYERVLDEEGHEQSEKYLMRFQKKMPKMLSAIWELHLERAHEQINESRLVKRQD